MMTDEFGVSVVGLDRLRARRAVVKTSTLWSRVTLNIFVLRAHPFITASMPAEHGPRHTTGKTQRLNHFRTIVDRFLAVVPLVMKT